MRLQDIGNMQTVVAKMGVRGLKIHAESLKRGDERKRYYNICFVVIAAKTSEVPCAMSTSPED
mgnify:CR=1 FL=1